MLTIKSKSANRGTKVLQIIRGEDALDRTLTVPVENQQRTEDTLSVSESHLQVILQAIPSPDFPILKSFGRVHKLISRTKLKGLFIKSQIS
jgi:hypothetical protein